MYKIEEFPLYLSVQGFNNYCDWMSENIIFGGSSRLLSRLQI